MTHLLCGSGLERLCCHGILQEDTTAGTLEDVMSRLFEMPQGFIFIKHQACVMRYIHHRLQYASCVLEDSSALEKSVDQDCPEE